nr:MAG TPA: hypothetical protein [Podoviridae sp. ctY3D12]
MRCKVRQKNRETVVVRVPLSKISNCVTYRYQKSRSK